MPIIDGLQHATWPEKTFRQMREGGPASVHATVCHTPEETEKFAHGNRLRFVRESFAASGTA